MSATQIKITVCFVEPTEATKAQQETAWNYLRYDFGKYLNREFYEKCKPTKKGKQ